MKIFTYIGQTIAGILYTGLITLILGWLLRLLFNYMVDLSPFWMAILILVGFLGVGKLLSGLSTLISMLYIWCNRENIVATILSVICMLVQVIIWLVQVWSFSGGTSHPVEIITKIFFTLTILGIGTNIIFVQITAYANNKK